jgi:hypothetical protein
MENVTIMPLTDVEKSVKRAVCFMFGIFGHHQISGRKDMKKLFSFVALLFVFALFQISPLSRTESGAERANGSSE